MIIDIIIRIIISIIISIIMITGALKAMESEMHQKEEFLCVSPIQVIEIFMFGINTCNMSVFRNMFRNLTSTLQKRHDFLALRFRFFVLSFSVNI